MADRKKTRKGCLIGVLIVFVLLVVMVVLVGAVVLKGFDGIPVLSDFLNPELSVDYDDRDLDRVYDKLQVDQDGNSPTINDLIFGRAYISEESVNVDTVLTSEEITAAMEELSGRQDYIQNIQVRTLGDEGFEMSFELDHISDLLEEELVDVSGYDLSSVTGLVDGMTIYYRGEMSYSKAGGIKVEPEQVKTGPIPVSGDVVDDLTDNVVNELNGLLNTIPALNLESLEISEEGLVIVGDIPKNFDQPLD